MPIEVQGRCFTFADDAPAIAAPHRFHLTVTGADVRVSEAEARALFEFLQWRLNHGKPATPANEATPAGDVEGHPV